MVENENQPNNGEAKFTQADVDRIISNRLAEERKKYPTQEEMEAYRAFKTAQQTDAEKLASMTTERDTANNRLAEVNREVERLKHERYLLSKGVAADDLEYYDFKISKGVTDGKTYEAVAEEFIAAHKQNTRVDFGGNLGGGSTPKTPNALMNDILRRAAKH